MLKPYKLGRPHLFGHFSKWPPSKSSQINCKGQTCATSAQKHINRPLGQWQHVIFCDESRFVLFRIDNRIRVRRLVGESNRNVINVITSCIYEKFKMAAIEWGPLNKMIPLMEDPGGGGGGLHGDPSGPMDYNIPIC